MKPIYSEFPGLFMEMKKFVSNQLFGAIIK
jgi:hypothetical protein